MEMPAMVRSNESIGRSRSVSLNEPRSRTGVLNVMRLHIRRLYEYFGRKLHVQPVEQLSIGDFPSD